MDVLNGYTADVEVVGEQECLVELLEYLGAVRYRNDRRLRTLLRRNGAALRKRLRRASRRIGELLPADGERGSDVQLIAPKEAMATALKLSGELAAPTTLTRKTERFDDRPRHRVYASGHCRQSCLQRGGVA
jgi:hypothetical protein